MRPRRRARARRAIGHRLALLIPLAITAAVRAGQDDAATGEGAVENDCFLPESAAGAEALADGDSAHREDRPTDAFEAWRRALTAGATGEATAPQEGAGQPASWRRVEGLEAGVLRRLETSSDIDGQPVGAAFGARFDALAASELRAAGHSPVALRSVERRNPATLAAATAALRLFDLDLEDGRIGSAATWLARGRTHTSLRPDAGAAGDDLTLAIARRQEALDTLRSARAPEAWRNASALASIGDVAHVDERSRVTPGPPEPGRGVRPGLVFLDDGRVAVQSADRVAMLDPGRPRLLSSFRPADLLPRGLGRPPAASGPWREPPGWPLLPETDGRDLVLVQGRWNQSSGGNALLCVRPGAAILGDELGQGAATPSLRWALRDGSWRRPDGEVVRPTLLAGFEGGEFQPGPIVFDRTVLVQVRIDEGDVRAWLLALDLATGAPLWRRLLAKGSDLQSDAGRFEVRSRAVAAGQPLTLFDGRVFAGTSLGAGALLDAVDGRVLWTLKNRRRDASEPGWAGERPAVVRGPDGQAASLVWTPPDSDRMYLLRPDAGADLFAGAPLPLGEAEALIAADPEELLLFSRAGPAHTVTAWNTVTGGRTDGAHLLSGELFAGSALASDQRVLACTGFGLYLFDRDRDLYLRQSLELAGGRRDAGGAVHARDDLVLVLGTKRLWAFAVR